MKIVRVGQKFISRQKIDSFVDEILEMRGQGFSQLETARRLGIDRAFISRLEKLGEIRKGKAIGVVGFPVKNKEEVEALLQQEGVDFWLIMTDRERWDFIRNKSGLELFDEVMSIMSTLSSLDAVIVIGSDYRIDLARRLFRGEVLGIQLGESPLKSDVEVDVANLRAVLRLLTRKGGRGEAVEKDS